MQTEKEKNGKFKENRKMKCETANSTKQQKNCIKIVSKTDKTKPNRQRAGKKQRKILNATEVERALNQIFLKNNKFHLWTVEKKKLFSAMLYGWNERTNHVCIRHCYCCCCWCLSSNASLEHKIEVLGMRWDENSHRSKSTLIPMCFIYFLVIESQMHWKNFMHIWVFFVAVVQMYLILINRCSEMCGCACTCVDLHKSMARRKKKQW